jgi:hypothetical protein
MVGSSWITPPPMASRYRTKIYLKKLLEVDLPRDLVQSYSGIGPLQLQGTPALYALVFTHLNVHFTRHFDSISTS